MTDLSDFGVDVPDDSGSDDATDTGESQAAPGPNYDRNGRCPALNTGDRTRCTAAVSRMKDAEGFCGVHGRQANSWTIHDNPRFLIRATGQGAARCRAERVDGSRCTNSCGPLEHFCGTHRDWDHGTVDALEPGELDVDLIREALTAIENEEDD